MLPEPKYDVLFGSCMKTLVDMTPENIHCLLINNRLFLVIALRLTSVEAGKGEAFENRIEL